MAVTPFPRKPLLSPAVLNAIIIALVGLCVTFGYLIIHEQPSAEKAASLPVQSISVIDGDTVRLDGNTYRLVGFDTPERGDKARCDDERNRAEAATVRLRNLVSGGDARLIRVACACRPGQEGTKNCNFGRLCGSLSIGGRDVGGILISEGLAHPYVCGATSRPPRRPWCVGL
jgi:endonuclease YncB( thermonuclease family)